MSIWSTPKKLPQRFKGRGWRTKQDIYEYNVHRAKRGLMYAFKSKDPDKRNWWLGEAKKAYIALEKEDLFERDVERYKRKLGIE